MSHSKTVSAHVLDKSMERENRAVKVGTEMLKLAIFRKQFLTVNTRTVQSSRLFHRQIAMVIGKRTVEALIDS